LGAPYKSLKTTRTKVNPKDNIGSGNKADSGKLLSKMGQYSTGIALHEDRIAEGSGMEETIENPPSNDK
jgi:hypothetical protein